MEKSLSDFQNQFEETIIEAKKAFEKGWAELIELTSLFGSKFEYDISLHRLMSYNPSNSKIKDSTFYHATSLLTELIAHKESTLNASESIIEIKDWIILAHSYLMLNDYVKAYSIYTRIHRHSDQISDGSFWYGIAIVYQHFNIYKKAIEFFLKCQEHSPIFEAESSIRFRLALCYRSNNQIQESISLLESLLDSPPNGLISDDIKFHLAFAYQLLNQKEQALLMYQELLNDHPNTKLIVIQYVWYLSLQSETNTAEEFIHSLSDDVQKDPIIQFISANIAMKHLDFKTSYELYSQCRTYWINNPLFWCNIGILYFKNEQYQDSTIAFQRALFLKIDIPEVWYNIGLIYEIKNEKDKARRIYLIGIQKCSDSTILKKKFEQLTLRGYNLNKNSCQPLDINETNLVVQIPDKIGLIQNLQVPRFAACNLEIDDKYQKTLDLLITPMFSLFSEE